MNEMDTRERERDRERYKRGTLRVTYLVPEGQRLRGVNRRLVNQVGGQVIK